MKKRKQRELHLLNQPLDKQNSIAFICSFCLGDALISLVTVNNLVRNGYNVTVFGDYAHALRDWFPHLNIKPLIKVEQQKELQPYDVVLHMYESPLSLELAKWHPRTITLSDSIHYLNKMTMTDIQVTLCEKEFQLTNLTRNNEMQPIAGLVKNKYSNRIIIHPTSSLLRKNWPAKKFIKLAQLLQKEGFESYFIVSPKERPEWEWIQTKNMHLPSFDSLSDVAKFVYESGYFIGNDSGIGHLASNLGIATISIILRKSVARQWRPSWAEGKVVLSPSWLNPRPIKEKFWKIFTRVKTVKKAFDDLRLNADCESQC